MTRGTLTPEPSEPAKMTGAIFYVFSRFLCVQGGQHIVDGESGGVGVGQHACHERAQPPVALARRVGLGRRGADERPDAAPGLDDARALELGVHARHCIGIDRRLDRELPDSRQLIAGPQPAGGDRRAQTTLELRVDRRRVARVDRDDVHVSDYTSVLVQ